MTVDAICMYGMSFKFYKKNKVTFLIRPDLDLIVFFYKTERQRKWCGSDL